MVATYDKGKLKITSAERSAAITNARGQLAQLKNKQIEKMSLEELRAVVYYLLVRFDLLDDVTGM